MGPPAGSGMTPSRTRILSQISAPPAMTSARPGGIAGWRDFSSTESLTMWSRAETHCSTVGIKPWVASGDYSGTCTISAANDVTVPATPTTVRAAAKSTEP